MSKISMIILFLLAPGFVSFAAAPQIDYSVKAIPKELVKNSKIVIRFSIENFEINSEKSAVYSKSYAITILNKDALDFANLKLRYNDFSRISTFKMAVFDEFGNKIKKIPNSELLDYAAYSEYSLYESERIKEIDATNFPVPFTIEVSYSINYSGLLNYPTWIPQQSFNVGVEKSIFSIKTIEELPCRYKAQNFEIEPVFKNEHSTYTWEVSNLQSINKEPLSPPFLLYAPILYTAPSKFKIGGYTGNSTTWSDFGLWAYSLIEDRDLLPSETCEKVKEMVQSSTSDASKVKILYNYLQENTRYISIQEGIGGWQPLPAETVDRLKYGDCKALTLYMKALLKVVGINSFYTLVKAGEFEVPMIKDFPSNQFNHAILCVPLLNDTIWLECTNSDFEEGYLGTFTDDRDVLIVSKEGGRLAKTPMYKMLDNLQLQTAIVHIYSDGSADCNMSNSFNGLYFTQNIGLIRGSTDDKKRSLNSHISIPNFKIIDFKHNEIRAEIPVLTEEINLQLSSYGSVIGNKLFLPLNLANKSKSLPRSRDKRLNDIYLFREMLEIDSVIYFIPKEFEIESISKNEELDSDFGSYKCTITTQGNKITYVRRMHLNKGVFDKTDYDEFFTYIENITIMDNAQVVLVKLD